MLALLGPLGVLALVFGAAAEGDAEGVTGSAGDVWPGSGDGTERLLWKYSEHRHDFEYAKRIAACDVHGNGGGSDAVGGGDGGDSVDTSSGKRGVKAPRFFLRASHNAGAKALTYPIVLSPMARDLT